MRMCIAFAVFLAACVIGLLGARSIAGLNSAEKPYVLADGNVLVSCEDRPPYSSVLEKDHQLEVGCWQEVSPSKLQQTD